MRVSKWRIALVVMSVVGVLVAIPVAVSAVAQTFTDVPPTDWAFEDVEWLADEGLTNGCGDGTTFCPDGNVTRREMAAFTRRLADAVTPTIFTTVEQMDLDASDNCEIGPYTPPFDQQATFNGATYYSTSAAGGNAAAKVTASVNGGAFTAVSGQYWIYDEGSDAGHYLNSPLSGGMILEAGQTYRFGVSNIDSNITYGGCELVVTIHHGMPDSTIMSAVPALSTQTAEDDQNK